MKGCYIHIPFCKNICSYCDFCKMLYDKKYIDSYLDALEKEIKSKYRNDYVETIYIGGGTPSVLDEDDLERLLNICSTINKTSDYEYTIEANFDSITNKKLDILKRYGVNRISFGLESRDLSLLRLMNRCLDIDKVIESIRYCKKIGINNINVDLIYALPNQDISILNRDIDFILSLDVPHISTYSLILEEHTKLYIDGYKNINQDLDFSMYENICKRLKDNGYIHYEISNFSKEGYSSRHNICYWNNDLYYGFGLGASGYIDNIRYSNTRSLSNYIDGNYVYEEESLEKNDLIYYEIILAFRLKWGIDKNKFISRYNNPISYYYDYSNLVKDGYLIETDDYLYIPEKYWYISNEIMVKLLEECKSYEER